MRCAHAAPTETLTGPYSEEEFFDDLLRVTQGETDEDLARHMIHESKEVLNWIGEQGVRFQPSLGGTLSLGRTNSFFLGGGRAMLNSLYQTATRFGVDIVYNAEVVDLDITDGFFQSATVKHGGEEIAVLADTFVAAAGNPNIAEELKKGKQIGDTTYKCHLDGYDQTDMITGKGPSNRHEIWYFGESELGAVRIDDYKYRFIDQPGGWLGEKTKPDVPYLINLRLDPFERTGWPDSGTKYGAQQYFDWFKYEFWRFVFVQQQVEKLAMTAIEFPPMQRGASFNLDAVKAKIAAAQASVAK